MSKTDKQTATVNQGPDANWGAVGVMATMVTCLVGAELLPISLLSPIALDLNVSQGMAGQAISVTSIAGVISSLFAAIVSRQMDRRLVLMAFTLLFVVSNIVVGLASN